MNGQTFLDFLEELVLIQPEYSILMMENARIHHVTNVHSFMDMMELEYMYLPPYCKIFIFDFLAPDYQPIELAFGWIKRNLNSDLLLYEAIIERINKIESYHLQSWIRHCAKNWTLENL